MKAIKIHIDETESPLFLNQIKYVFKTILTIGGFPIHFIKKGFADIRYGKNNRNCRLFIKSNKNLSYFLKNKGNITIIKKTLPCLIFKKEQQNKDLIKHSNKKTIINNDIIFSIYYILRGIDEKFIEKDKYGRPKFYQSFLYKNGYIHKPIINYYINFLRDLFKDHKPLDIWADNKKYCVMLSHDVDYPEIRPFLEVLRHPNKIPKIISSNKKSFWKFKEWIDFENKNSLKSAFYFCSINVNPFTYYITRNPFYDIKKNNFKEIFKTIKKEGFEIGLHTSYNGFKSLQNIKKEKSKLEKCADIVIMGNRHHYFRTAIDGMTSNFHNKSGILYDSSLAFVKHSGFRRGICSPFFSFDYKKEIPVLQLPLILMDSHLFGYLKYSNFKDYKSNINSLLDSIKRFNGIFVVDYHVRVWNEDFFPEWRESYIYLISQITKKNDFYCDTPLNICKYWLKRNKKIQESSKDETNKIKEL